MLTIHSTKNVEDPSAFCAKKKNLKLGDLPPEAMQWMEWPCICFRSDWGVVNAATPWGLIE